MKATGHTGELRYRYQVAARLGNWNVEPVTGTAGHRFRVSASVVAVVHPWITRRPLDLHLTFGRSTWVWHVLHPEEPIEQNLAIEVSNPPTIIQRSE